MSIDSKFDSLPSQLNKIIDIRSSRSDYISAKSLESNGSLFIQDGNHGNNRPRQNEFIDDGVPFVRPPDLLDGEIDFMNCSQINQKAYTRIRKGIGKPGDILLTTNATIGRKAIAGSNAPKTFIVNPQITIWRSTDPMRIDQKYLYYFMDDASFINQLWSFCGDNSTFNYVCLSLQKEIVLSLPPLHEQKAIAHILGTLDKKIELNRKTNETLEKIAKALFKSWFIDFDPVREKSEGRSTGLPDEISDLFPDSFEDSEFGQIPKGWDMKTADQLCEVITKGTTPTSIGGQFSDEGIPFYKVESISECGQIIPGKCSFIDAEVDLLLKRSRIIEGDILFSIAGTIGRTTLIRKENVPANTNQALAILRPNNNLISSEFMYLYLRDKKRIELARSRVVQSVQANFSLGELKSLPLVVPSESLRKMFEGIIEKLFDKITITHNNSIHLSEIRNALLPKLISGELRIPDDEKMIEDL